MSDDGEHPDGGSTHGEPPDRGTARDRSAHGASTREGSTRDGLLLGGRYRLTERIGSGGMGTVWRAVDELVDREVAVKQPRLPGDPEDAVHQRASNRLYREARAAARVDHSCAVTIHDVVVEGGLPWIVMELIRGESLHEVLQRGALTPAESARVGLAVVGALRAAHSVGIVHRDVKPANVLLGPHGRVVLTDFGIAHIQGEESLTVSGEFIGSLEFIAPERMSGRGAGPLSDLWSLGVLLYAAVEGWSPFRRTTLESTLAAILSVEPPEPKQAGPLGPLIVRLLAKDPADRPDPDEVVAALEAVAEGWPVPPAPDRPEALPAQDPSALRELADDTGTVRLGGGVIPVPPSREEQETEEESDSDDVRAEPPQPPAEPDSPTPTPSPRTGTSTSTTTGTGTGTGTTPSPTQPKPRTRLLPLTLLAALLLVGGIWIGTSLSDNDGGGGASVSAGSAGSTTEPGTSGSPTPSPTSPTPGSPYPDAVWTARQETELNAVLSLPRQYVRFHEQGGAEDQPRMAIYDNDEVIQVRLTQWDRAPRSPMGQAQTAAETWAGYGESSTQYTQTSFQGYDAVLADTTYETEGRLVRVMELFVLTDDSRMYELRVDMPKGTPDEKRGTAVFKGARERMRILPVRPAT
ncbi:serine/threonine-protein kinase [Streptomyces sp. NPDC002845]